MLRVLFITKNPLGSSPHFSSFCSQGGKARDSICQFLMCFFTDFLLFAVWLTQSVKPDYGIDGFMALSTESSAYHAAMRIALGRS